MLQEGSGAPMHQVGAVSFLVIRAHWDGNEAPLQNPRTTRARARPSGLSLGPQAARRNQGRPWPQCGWDFSLNRRILDSTILL